MMHNTGFTADPAEVAALAVDGPQPVWMTLNGARERAFTGEIVFETDPEVFAYLDNGIVYYAERASDVSLGRRLLAAGVVDIAQLERGTVRVGDIEHLGRLFDRVPNVDRDAVVVLAETVTQELIADLANQSIATVRFTAYRHHPSGVHRWFVAPLEPAAVARPTSAVAQLDSAVVDELPSLPFDADDAEDLVIEWDDDIDDISERPAAVFELSFELEEFSDADADGARAASVDVEPVEELDVPDALEAPGEDFAFSVVWPDGSQEPATEATAYVEESNRSLAEPSDVEPSDVEMTDTEMTDVEMTDTEMTDVELDAALDAELDAVLTQADDVDFQFTMPPLVLSDEPERADADVPDDVAEAVRRAIAAIESASITEAEIADVEILDEPPITELAEPAPVVQGPAESPAGIGGFAPPTMATRAEVMYAEMEADDSLVDAAAPTLDGSSPSSGVASVVFVDDPAENDSDGGNDRSSALRRLIGSLRRKDH